MRPILITGAAGFIGFHLARRLLADGRPVVGVDDLNAYYDVSLKQARLARLHALPGFEFHPADVADRAAVGRVFADVAPERVLHMAAQAGVRYSLQHPHAYADANLVGFLNVLEECRHRGVGHLVYASSSSVYGANRKVPFSVHDPVDHPISLYAATKKANELMAHSYSHLFGLPTTGLRFFTVYGPWGRPDMAYFSFTKAVLEGRPIDLFNHGEMQRDFTYVDDAVEAIVRLVDRMPTPSTAWDPTEPDPATSAAPYRLYNIGNHAPEPLGRLVALIERYTGRTAEKRLRPIQPGDVVATCADVDDLMRDAGFSPATPLDVGLERFVRWYRWYYEEGAPGADPTYGD
ncbi:MAG TPA: NAD-dependent epimerase [Gemmatimonadaceae bacterium]|nr:NAD-dependent epimerase [Gemmatimonadaceae bacterium]